MFKSVARAALRKWSINQKNMEAIDIILENETAYIQEVKSISPNYEVFLNFKKDLTIPDLSELGTPDSITVLQIYPVHAVKNFTVNQEEANLL